MTNQPFLRSTVFRLGVLGARWEELFAARISGEGIRPKHVALLAVVRDGKPGTQQDLAVAMGVGPSLIVALANELVDIGAVDRERDPRDRRRQRLFLTASGSALLLRCEDAMADLDRDVEERLGTRSGELDAILAALESAPPQARP